jgi:DNA polymerase III delta prime subunit
MSEPWIEKYRPKNINDIVLSENNKLLLNKIIEKDEYPNMIFYGPPGTGKTTTILCLIKEYQKKHKCKNNYLHLNASHQRGIDVIRNQIYGFTNSKSFFTKCRKFVLLDEIDSMTKPAQQNLYYIISKTNNSNVSYILVCNYLNKLINEIKDNLIILHFNKTSKLCLSFINNCIKEENVSIKNSVINDLKKLNYHDLRSIINNIQNYDKTTILLNNDNLNKLLKLKNPKPFLLKLLKQHDPKAILLGFFNYIYENYQCIFDEEIVEILKYIIMENTSVYYFINELLPFIKNKIDTI